MTRRRGLLAVTGAVLALALLMVGLAPRPAGQAAQGQKWLTGVHWAGFLQTNTGGCGVTVVSEFLAITAKHCGTVNPRLVLNLSSLADPGHDREVKKILPNRDLDVEAIFLWSPNGLTVPPLREAVERDWFYGWGYGNDWSGNKTNHLTRADFNLPELCTPGMPADRGNLCFQTNAKNSICYSDSGGPITQKGAIIGMITGVEYAGSVRSCSEVVKGQALTVKQMQPWLNQMIKDADPFD